VAAVNIFPVPVVSVAEFAVTVDAAAPPTVADKLLVKGQLMVTAPCAERWVEMLEKLVISVKKTKKRLKNVEINGIHNRFMKKIVINRYSKQQNSCYMYTFM
jgi:hypothetical protein